MKISALYQHPPFSAGNYKNKNQYGQISFDGHKVFLMDKGSHSAFLQRLAGILSDNLDIEEKETDYSEHSPFKKLSSLKKRLEETNALDKNERPEYIAIPAIVKITYSELNKLLKNNYNIEEKVTPENVKDYKGMLLDFFKRAKNNPELFADYPDLNKGQEAEYLYDTIQEINKAVSNGIKVYTASQNYDRLLYHLCRDKGLTPELYYYLACGKDEHGRIAQLYKDVIDKEGLLEFNLINLSEANNVGILGPDNKVHPFSSYDSCINTYARGIYNCTPLRQNGNITGYSISDDLKKDFDAGAFHSHAERFSGLKIKDIEASDDECRELLACSNPDLIPERLKGKLFPAVKVFTPEKIKADRINLLGAYTDYSREHFYSANSNGVVSCREYNLEKSERPSMKGVLGSCLALIRAITEDAAKKDSLDISG